MQTGTCGDYNCDRNAECIEQKCVCRSGFYGNGVQCEYETRPTVTAGIFVLQQFRQSFSFQVLYAETTRNVVRAPNASTAIRLATTSASASHRM